MCLECICCAVAKSCLTLSDPMNCMQHTKPPCPSPTPRVYSNSCPLSRWCHPTMSSSVAPFSSCPQSFPPSGGLKHMCVCIYICICSCLCEGVSVFMYLYTCHPFECLCHIPLNRCNLLHWVSDQHLRFPNSCYYEQCTHEYCSCMFILLSVFLRIHSEEWDLGIKVCISSVQSLSHVRLFVTPWTAARQASLSISNSRSLSKLMSTESVMPSNHLILRCPLLILPSIFPSIRVFSDESALRIRWPKYWSFSFSISPSNEHPGLISFRIDWLDLLAVQGTLNLTQMTIISTTVCRNPLEEIE